MTALTRLGGVPTLQNPATAKQLSKIADPRKNFAVGATVISATSSRLSLPVE